MCLQGDRIPLSRLTLTLREVYVHISYSYCHYRIHILPIAAEILATLLYSNQKAFSLLAFL